MGRFGVTALVILLTILVLPFVSAAQGPPGLNFALPTVVGGSYYGLPTPQPPISIKVADVNGDGKADILMAASVCNQNAYPGTCNGATVAVMLGGTSRWVRYDAGGYDPNSVAVADVNGDGKPDLVVANKCAGTSSGLVDYSCPDTEEGSIAVLLGNGDGTFRTPVLYASGGFDAVSVVIADVNGDGKPDLVAINSCAASPCGSQPGVVAVLLGNGNGSFQSAVTYPTGQNNAVSVAVADVNGDGRLDLLVGNNPTDSTVPGEVGVLIGNGNGTFQRAVNYQVGTGIASVAVADVNKDGKPDLLVSTARSCTDSTCASTVGTEAANVLLGNGDGTFKQAVAYPQNAASLSNSTRTLVAADFDGDGKIDLAVAGLPIGVFLGNGDGTFQPVVNFLPNDPGPPEGNGYPVPALALTSRDTNGDGRLDLLASECADDRSAGGCEAVAVLLINTTTKATSTSLKSSLNPAAFAKPVTFTSTVTTQDSHKPTGSVTFFDGATQLASTPVSSTGVATFTTSTLPVGTHTITASYGGDSWLAFSKSPTVTEAVSGVAAISLTPSTLTFPVQTIFTVSATKSVTLKNVGSGALNIRGLTASANFSETNTCAKSMAPGASCVISVKFAPKAKNTLTGAISVTDNASGSPQKVALTGVGTYLQLSSTSLNFGSQPLNTKSLSKTITVTNKGSGSVSFTSVSVVGADLHDFGDTKTCGSTLTSGASCFITVTFKPLAKGTRTAAISIGDNAGGSPQQVYLSGLGT